MKRKYTLIIVALLVSLFIYLFYRTGKTVVNELVIRVISLHTYTSWKAAITAAIPLNKIVIYSLPEGLWVFCITLTSRPYYFKLRRRRVNCVIIPLVFCVGLEFLQLIHITNGRFDFMDIAVSFIFWLTAGYLLKDKSEKQNLFAQPNARSAICLASYGIVYLAHVIK